jgi:hypothetical protein
MPERRRRAYSIVVSYEKNPDPDPDETTGLEDGGGVPPGETPPGECCMSGAGAEESHNPHRGWRVAPLIVIGVLVVVVLLYFLGRALDV